MWMFQHSLFQLSESDNILIKSGSAQPPASALAKNLTGATARWEIYLLSHIGGRIDLPQCDIGISACKIIGGYIGGCIAGYTRGNI